MKHKLKIGIRKEIDELLAITLAGVLVIFLIIMILVNRIIQIPSWIFIIWGMTSTIIATYIIIKFN